MRADELRAVLLVKAVEEGDRAGTLLPAADRAAASRAAMREAGGASDMAALLPRRSRTLLERITARHPFVASVLALSRGPAWVGAALLLAALALGFGLSALDGTRRINILGFPAIGLALWNLAAYAALAVRRLRARPGGPAARGWLVESLAQATLRLGRGAVERSRQFNTALAEALLGYLREWYGLARPLFTLRALRILHLAALAVGVGLVAGLYLRGLALDYRAGWESTFLEPAQAHRLLRIAYGPASFVTRVPIPGAAEMEAIRWQGEGGGEGAARWIHLMAGTVAICVIVPRALLALLASLALARRERRMTPPPTVHAYFRAAFARLDGGIGRGIVLLVPYAYEPSPAVAERLRDLLPAALGEHLAVEWQPTTPYGDEDQLVEALAERGAAIADVVVLLFSLAATPEDENHGVLVAGVRDWLARTRPEAQMLVLVDEGPYRSRVGGEGGALERLDERRGAWIGFVRARGVKAGFVDLSADDPVLPLEPIRAAVSTPGAA